VKISPREYQKNIFETAKDYNTLIVLPTGLGKTVIALMLIEHYKKLYPNKKVIFLAPTKPLVHQHAEFLKKYSDLDPTRIVAVTGEINKEKRLKLYKGADVIVITPQTLKNDIINGLFNLDNVSLIIFDEAHRAVGNYAYTTIAEEAKDKNIRIVGLTASPGSEREKILEIIRNLNIERIEYRKETDRDVRPYVKAKIIKYIPVELDREVHEAAKYLEEAINLRKKKLEELGVISSKLRLRDVAELVNILREKISYSVEEKYKDALVIASEILIISHALRTLLTQTYRAFLKFCENLFENAQKVSEKNVSEDVRFKKAYLYVKELVKRGKEHPKLLRLIEEIKRRKDKKIIVFAQLVDTVDQIVEELKKQGIKAEKFVGRKGMSQKKQLEVINKFRAGLFNVLVASSVAEEGLDIPKVDSVIFYEPIPSAIRAIQRRGRTGRMDIGEVVILYAKNTIDEKYLYISRAKEKRMYQILEELKKEMTTTIKKTSEEQVHETSSLDDYLGFKLRIIADQRERNSKVIDALKRLGVGVRLEQLDVSDYLVGDYVVERKTVKDFVSSIVDGRIWEQLNKLTKVDKKKLLIIEGEEDLYLVREVNPNVIRSVILAIADKGIPMIRTKNYADTAYYLKVLAEKSRKEPKKIAVTKKAESPIEALAAFPGIGEKFARELLKRYKTIKNVINASLAGLSLVLGEARARKFKEFIEQEYKEE